MCGGKKNLDSSKNKQIEKELQKSKEKLEKEVKILLLGAGESGKSTIAKQMRILYLEGFGAEERLHYKDIINCNIMASMRVLIQGAKKFGLKISEECQTAAEFILQTEANENQVITPSLAADLKLLWNDGSIRAAYDRQNELQLYDSTEYYLNALDKISSHSYIPDEQDILRSRVKTTGIVETEFDVSKVHFRLVDVGGQRSERKKWIHCFSGVTAVLFCVAISEYDLKLFEDETVNRLDESLKLFEEICNSKWFLETAVILFLNKSDIFKEKIKKVDLSVCFPAYKGGLNFEKACGFIIKTFVQLNKSPTRSEIYTHVTCATDTSNIRYVFNVVKDVVIKKVLVSVGIM